MRLRWLAVVLVLLPECSSDSTSAPGSTTAARGTTCAAITRALGFGADRSAEMVAALDALDLIGFTEPERVAFRLRVADLQRNTSEFTAGRQGEWTNKEVVELANEFCGTEVSAQFAMS